MKKIIGVSTFLTAVFLCSCTAHYSTRQFPRSDISTTSKAEFIWPQNTLTRRRQGYSARAVNYMIAAQGPETSKAAAKMFEMGGNAVDAAVAASFVLSVERPQSTGIGGGGFMLIHSADTGKTVAVDFRERAPSRIRAKDFLDAEGNVISKKSLDGIFSAGVPGLVAGLLEVQSRFGKLSRQQVLAPAIELAETGFKIYPHLASSIMFRKSELEKYPASRAIFFDATGKPLKEGDRLVQKDLAQSLRYISARGRRGFYSGPVAEAIAAESNRLGGKLTIEDLKNYKVEFREPVRGRWKNYEIVSMPPPSSGGIHILEILNMLENDSLASNSNYSRFSIHMMASAMQRAYADRARFLGDPDFVRVPQKGLSSKKYAAELRRLISPEVRTSSDQIAAGNPLPYESSETSHLSIMDSAGNAVSTTQTVNFPLGSGIVIPTTGIVLNNEMDDFSLKAGAANAQGALGGNANRVQARKRPLSSMSPTIVMSEDKPVLVVGAPGGTRIITCITETILNYLLYAMPLYESVATLRYHHQWMPDQIMVEPPGFPRSVTKQLKKMGYKIDLKDDPAWACRVQAVSREGDELVGASDPRDVGLALGR